MRTYWKQLLLICGIAALVLSGCSKSSEANATDDLEVIEAFTKGSNLKSSFSNALVPDMKGVVENARLQLLVDEETGVVAVVDKQSGEVWYSNPAERDEDTIATGTNKNLLSSQLKLDFYNSFGQLNSINSFADSAAFKQIAYEKIDNSLKVTYQFGTVQRGPEDLPKMLSEERMEQKLLSKLDKAGQRALKIAYTLNDETKVYERNDGALKGIQFDRAIKAFETAEYTEEDRAFDDEENGVSEDKQGPRIFLASVVYSLDEDSLVVNVPIKDVYYPAEYPINTISLLSFFGAAGKEDEGSIFVPDGSGALIHFNNGKNKYPPYQQNVYGTDQTMERTLNVSRSQAVRLPVFGMIYEDKAMMGIIESGAAAAAINADISGRLNSYNQVYPIFTLINKGEVALDAGEQQRSLPRFQEQPMKEDFTVRYVFFDQAQANYAKMAGYYQQYLIKNGGLPEQKLADGKQELPFYLQLIGSINKKKHIAGIPYNAMEPLTTFEQAQSIIGQLKERQVDELKVQYSGWFNGGLNHTVPSRIKVDKAIGGANGLRKFVAFAEEQNIDIFPDIAVLNAHASGSGFKASRDASRRLNSLTADFYPLDLALNARDRTKTPSYVVSPRLVSGYSQAILKPMTSFNTKGISLRDLASQLNSDFKKNNQLDRTEAQKISVQALSDIRQNELKIMGVGGNAYSFPYLSDIVDIPMSNSEYKIEDESVPFLQMVVHGFIDYTGPAFNLSSYTNDKHYLLKMLEYGGGVNFTWIYAPNYTVKDTEYSHLYAVNYELWLEQAVEMYQEANSVMKQVQNSRMVAHEKVQDGVYKSSYENGFYVIVNYNHEKIAVDGKVIEAESYVTGGGQS